MAHLDPASGVFISMKSNTKILIVIGALALIVLGYFGITKYQREAIPARTTEVVERAAYNFNFTYTGGEDGYSFVEPPLTDAVKAQGIEAVYILMNAHEYTAYQALPEGGEAPKSMTVFVLKKEEESTTTAATNTPDIDKETRIKQWAEKNSSLSAYNLAQGTPDIVEVDGVKLLHYRADGLYPQETYITYYRGHYLLFVGQYDGEGDVMKSDFEALIQSLTFL